MTKYAYITLDNIGSKTGGGVVTHNESMALSQCGETNLFSRNNLGRINSDAQPDSPFYHDAIVCSKIRNTKHHYDLAHFYAGSFSRTIKDLKFKGTKITYTAAAHNLHESISEFERLGLNYPFEHMSDPILFSEYVDGYLNADLVICPSNHSKQAMEGFGCKNVKVIPHGIEINKPRTNPPEKFIVGYLGQCGPDKGLIYLLQAWKKINNQNAILVFAGRQSTELIPLIRQYGGGNIQIKGWVDDVDDFYRNCTVYCQPSVTEGFGIEVLEAMSNARPVICSSGAGACDVVEDGRTGYVVQPRSVDELADRFTVLMRDRKLIEFLSSEAYNRSSEYSWEKIRKAYQEEWMKIV